MPTITTTASRHHHLLALAVTEVLRFIILILREKEGEREHGEENDDIVIPVISHPVQYSE
ncbi:MAG TPA: hypothetical protein VFH28_05640 [Nitrososphaera sp.]|nr:hypothetical protein [Nitrososphaera sp.]